MKRIISIALCFMLVFTLCPSVFAAGDTMTWTGTSSGNWNVAGNWNPAQVPSSGDTAVIPASTVAAVVYDTTSVTLDCSGEVSVESGKTLWLTGTSYLKGGKLSGDGNFTIMVNDSNLLWSGGNIEGSGTLTVDSNTQLVIGADNDKALIRPLVNNGWVRLNAGGLSLMGGGTGTGTFTVSNGASLDFVQGQYSIGGAVPNLVVNGGAVTMWNTSSVSFNAGYRQESTGTLALKVWGAGPDKYCKLDVGGAAELGGVLEIDFINDYVPSPGDSFEIMTCGTRTGEFSSIINNMEDEGITFEPTYTETGLTLTVKQLTAPTAPQNFTATPGDGQVALSWTAPASDGGAAIIGYKVSKDSGVTWVTASTNASHTFTGLTNGTAYTFKVRAVNSVGSGAEASATATPAVYVCEIGGAKYATLDAALAAVTSGQTIKLLNNITHTSPIDVDGKTIYFELGDYNLLIDTSDNSDVSIHSVLTVNNGGKLKLTGAGAGKFYVKSTSNSHEYGIRVRDADSEVTVNNVDVTGESATGVYAKGGTVVINGDITAGHRGVVTAVVDGTSVTVNGNITVLGKASAGLGIYADEKTTISVTGDVTVQGTNYIGVHAAGGTIQVGGNVASSCIGAKAESRYFEGKGEVTIDGSLSAATPFVVVGTTHKTTADITEPTTKTGFLTYSDGVNSVWIGSVGNPGITAPTAPQNFTATPGGGRVALSWTAPASDGGAAISGYEVSKDNGLTWVTAGAGTSHTFIGLTNGTAYTFKARAVNSAGNGAAASATATPVAPTQPWQLYTWGGNFDGQLGDGTLQNKSTPTHIGTAEDWTTVSAGSGHTVALKSTGSLWAWGSNSYGQLGDGTSELRDSPVHIGSDYDWAAIETGEYHTVALKTDGSLWAWGSNNIGQLGDGTTDNKNVPTRIAAGSTWIAVSAGRQHTVAIKSDGSLWAWGANSKGELGDGSTDFKKVPTQISTEQWALVSAGTKFTVALKADGSLWTWGWNNVGQLGDGTVVDKNVPTRDGTDTWLAAAAGDNHVVAIKSGGSLWAWGGNEYGELGNGSSDGVVDPPAHPVPTQIGTDTDWISVTTSYAHNAAFKTDGSLWLWGLNGVGQLGNGTSGNGADSPQRLDGTGTWLAVTCGGSHTAAVMEAGLTAPTAPQNFTATPSSGQVALSWEAPASNGGAAISGYQVSKDNGATWGTADTSTSHTFTGLTNGTAYTFKVRAVNSAGNGTEASATATPTANVCKIGATEYAALDNALAALVDNTPTTITLLQNITDTDGISLSRKKLTIDLNGKTLTVNNSTGIGIEMELSSELNITGPGNLNVCGNSTGLYLNQSSFAAAENVMVDITSDNGLGLGTDTHCSVSMHGNISGARGGISAGTGNTITVDGTVTSTGTGSENHAVRLGGRGNTVQVGNVIVSDGTGAGIYVADGGTVTVGSQTSSASVTGKGSGICTRQGSNTADITVYGDVTAGGGRAISAAGDADIKVYGNVKSISTLASAFAVEGFANSGDDISVSITGNVQGPNGVKYHGNNGTVSVGGNVTATGDASDTVGIYASYGSVRVTGNVASPSGIGAEAGENGEITIDGVLTGNTYVKVYYAIKTAADKEPNTTKEGYHTYQHNSAVVWIKDGASAATYLLTVENGTGGGSYLPGTPVNITANPPAQGKVFDKWTTSNGGSFGDANSASTTFTMPSGAVTVTATYKDAAAGTYTLTVNGSYAAVSGAGQYAPGAQVSIHAGSRSNYRFTGWTSPHGVPFANINNATTTFIMPAKNVTVTANWSYKGSSGSSGGESSTPTTPAAPPAPAYKADVKIENGTETTLPVTVDKDAGTASVDAGSQGLDQGGTNITIPSIPDVDTYSVGIPVPDLSTSDIQGTLTFNTDAGSVTVPSNMLTGVSGISGSKAEIAIGQGDKDNLPDTVKAAIGDRPLVQLSLSIDGKQTDWSNPDAPVTVSIPYTPTAAELANPESIVVWYIDGSGNVVSVPNGRYDPATGMVTFTTTHFSDYAVAYNKASFNDVTVGAWYSKAVGFIAAREITAGTGGGNFSPEARLTRGQFIVMLMKAYNIAPDANPKDNFSDAGGTYYTGYLAAAKRLGISAGIGNNMFAPEKEITRQEMFTLLYNALKVIGQLPQGDSDKTLDHFSDAGQIDSWAKEAMTLLVKTGTIGGNAGKLNPTSTTTRAEMAQVLYNLLSK